MKTLEEITYDAGRHALAEQDSFVNGIRQRTGTLLAAHALVASFLGSTVLRVEGLHAWGWVALVALVTGLVVAAVLLGPWHLVFAVDARILYADLYEKGGQATSDGSAELVAAAFGYQQHRDDNAPRVRAMSVLSVVFGSLMIVQTLAWIVELVG